MNDSLSIPDLSRRLNLDPADILTAIRRGDIEYTGRVVDQHGPRISQIAAIVFCIG